MAETSRPSAEKLYNNTALSDVKIKQIFNGKVREYHAHRAVLCLESEYFLNMFTGAFKEASDGTIELHDDDPDYFELLLKFIYTNEYDTEAVTKLAAEDKTKRISVSVGLYAVAEKYAVARLCRPVADDLQSAFEAQEFDDFTSLAAAVTKCFELVSHVDAPLGRTITKFVMDKRRAFTATDEFRRLLKRYPIFGAEVTLMTSELLSVLQGLRPSKCTSCHAEGLYRFDGYSHGQKAHKHCTNCNRQFWCIVP